MTRLLRLFDAGFRIFFLAAGLFAVLSVVLWEAWLGVHAMGGMVVRTPFAVAPYLWHAHEMIFGYAGAVLSGFLLTAVPNWTGSPPPGRGLIGFLAAVWFGGRLAVWWSAHLDAALVALLDLAFLPSLATVVLGQLIRRPKPQNLMFLGLLAILWTGNLLVHLEWMGWSDDGVGRGLLVGLFAMAAMIAVLGGRVTPAFTRNAMTRAGEDRNFPVSRRPLEVLGVASAIALPILFAVRAPDDAIAGVALLAGVAQALRLAGWRTPWTRGQPILWSLHLGFAMLAVGYILMALARWGWTSEVSALHVIGIGAIGGRPLAVMSRAIIGHSGLPLVAPRPIAVAYVLMAVAAVVRFAGGTLALDWYFPAMLLSGACWIIAFALFVVTLLPAMTAPPPR